MKSLSKFLDFLRDESGATAIEYSLFLGLIVLAISASIGNLGSSVGSMWNAVSGEVTNSVNNAQGG